jgi:two-component system, OmpR family, sensor kinase
VTRLGEKHRHEIDSDKDRRIAELEAAVEDLQLAVQVRDEFLISAAHELRNPITPIVMRLEMLLATVRAGLAKPDRIASDLSDLRDYITRYVKRANTLLDVSRLTTGKLRLEPTRIDLSALVRDVAQSVAPEARHTGSRLDLSVQEGVGGVWDPLAVQEIIENLLSNALKYGAGKPVEIILTADATTARIAVRDQGIGISAEDQARIFGRFERAVTRSQHGGFGVGLWIVGRLVAAMDGTITVTSRPGQGSAFVVSLPIQQMQQGQLA